MALWPDVMSGLRCCRISACALGVFALLVLHGCSQSEGDGSPERLYEVIVEARHTSGDPLQGMSVEVYSHSPGYGDLLARGVTDERGEVTFELPRGDYGLFVRSNVPQIAFDGPRELRIRSDRRIVVRMYTGY